MPLEATFIAIDNSDYMRNGDFAPSRMEAQQDAVNLLAGAKTQAHAPPRSHRVPPRSSAQSPAAQRSGA